MAGNANQSTIEQNPVSPYETYGNLEFRIAQPHHEPLLRRILRNNPIPGWITLSYEREPDFFQATTIEGDTHETIVCLDRDSQQAVGLSTRSIKKRFVNGSAMNVGYLGQLRVDTKYRNQIRPLKYGFKYFRRHIHSHDLAPYYLTSIISDNVRAKRILTANLPGFPTYQEIDTFSTLAIPCKRYKSRESSNGVHIAKATRHHLDAIVDCLNRNNQRYQFSSYWTKQDLLSDSRCRGISLDNFFIALRDDKVVGCLACWDQSAFKQTIVRDYKKYARYFRPLINMASKAMLYPALPKVGEEIKQVYLSHMAIDNDDPEILIELLKIALHTASLQGHQLLLVGLSQSNQMLLAIKKYFRHLTYSSQIYLVYWDDGKAAVNNIDNRTIHTDIALL